MSKCHRLTECLWFTWKFIRAIILNLQGKVTKLAITFDHGHKQRPMSMLRRRSLICHSNSECWHGRSRKKDLLARMQGAEDVQYNPSGLRHWERCYITQPCWNPMTTGCKSLRVVEVNLPCTETTPPRIKQCPRKIHTTVFCSSRWSYWTEKSKEN